MIICSQCGNTVEDHEQFCSECGTRVPSLGATQTQSTTPPQPQLVQTQPQQPAYAGVSAAAPAFEVGGSLPPQVPPASGQAISSIAPKVILGIVAGAFVLGVIILIAMKAGGDPPEKKLDEAIAKRNFFGPTSDNAHALYTQIKNSGASEDSLKPYAERLTPLLIESGYKLAKDLPAIGYDEPDASVWQDAANNLNWAVELNPGNNMMASRAAYCDGRVSFLQKQYDRALSLWNKAADVDKSWALPANGLGLIYQARRDFSGARSWFNNAISREPNWAIPYENIGNAYYQDKNRGSARDFYRQAMAKAPNWAKPHVHLGDMAAEDGDLSTAVSEYQTALDSNMIGLKGDELNQVQQRLQRLQQRIGK